MQLNTSQSKHAMKMKIDKGAGQSFITTKWAIRDPGAVLFSGFIFCVDMVACIKKRKLNWGQFQKGDFSVFFVFIC